jgi:hypothetical protein
MSNDWSKMEQETINYADFEKSLDKEIEKLNLSQYPLRSILTLFHLKIYMCCSEERSKESTCNCSTFPSIYSYFLNYINKCNKKIIGADAYDIFTAIPDEFQSELQKVINYGAFCEIAPYVWREVYEPDVINSKEVDLLYKEGSFDIEVKDAILTALGTGYTINDERSASVNYDEQVKYFLKNGKFNFELMCEEIKRGQEWYKKYWKNDNTISEEIYIKLEITKDTYVNFHMFWLSLCDYYIKSANAIYRLIKSEKSTSRLIQNEFLEHLSPFLKKSFFYEYLNEDIIGVKEEDFIKLMNYFAQDVNVKFNNLDGYFPVFFEFENAYLFSCYNVKTSLSSRNLLYLLNKFDKKLFDNIISDYLEPNLIERSINLLTKIPNIKIEKNKKWDKSEFDLLAYFEDQNVVLHIQVKGSIPVSGARMTERLEDRMEEGIEQITKFKGLEKSVKESILSDIFKKDICDITIVDILLGWGGFGTNKIWNKLEENNITPLNLVLLNQYIKQYDETAIADFQRDINELICEIIDNSLAKKTTILYEIGDKTIHYESFNYEDVKLLKYKI